MDRKPTRENMETTIKEQNDNLNNFKRIVQDHMKERYIFLKCIKVFGKRLLIMIKNLANQRKNLNWRGKELKSLRKNSLLNMMKPYKFGIGHKSIRLRLLNTKESLLKPQVWLRKLKRRWKLQIKWFKVLKLKIMNLKEGLKRTTLKKSNEIDKLVEPWKRECYWRSWKWRERGRVET